jgi:hypothetical protein
VVRFHADPVDGVLAGDVQPLRPQRRSTGQADTSERATIANAFGALRSTQAGASVRWEASEYAGSSTPRSASPYTPCAMDGGVVIQGRDPLAFLPGVAEQLGWYVYALRDPRDGAVFYAGKGIGNRIYQHARQVRKLAGQSSDQLKLARIRDIHDAGLEVRVEIIRHRIPDEKSAYEVEAAVIDSLALMGSDLANLVGGHGAERGWRPLEDIVAEYAAEPVEIAPITGSH